MLTGLRSRKHIAPFDAVQPHSVEECCVQLARPGRVALLAGGLDLIDRMKCGETFDTVVSLSGAADLSGIRVEDDAVVIGAATRHAAIAQSPILLSRLPGLARLWTQIGNPRVRFAGTIGGNLMSAQPHYDAMPALLTLGATATIADVSGRRRIALADLAGCGALLVDIRVPFAGRYLIADRSLHPALAVYLGAEIQGDHVTQLKIAVGGAYQRPAVVALPDASVGTLQTEAATLARDLAARLPEPFSDGLASSSYRRRMIELLARRLLVGLGHPE